MTKLFYRVIIVIVIYFKLKHENDIEYHILYSNDYHRIIVVCIYLLLLDIPVYDKFYKRTHTFVKLFIYLFIRNIKLILVKFAQKHF